MSKKEKYKIYLIYDQYTRGGELCTDCDPDYPRYKDTYYDFTPKGLRLEPPWSGKAIEINCDPRGLGHLYLVVVKYTTDAVDMLGSSHGNWHIEGVFEKYKEAENLVEDITKKQGQYVAGHWCPWGNYFDSITIERLSIWD